MTRSPRSQTAAAAASSGSAAESSSSSSTSNSVDDVRVGFLVHLGPAAHSSIGPGNYSPNVDASKPISPRAKFGQADRFLPSKLTYISPQHNADLLGNASPGPIYSVVPADVSHPRAPAASWGKPRSPRRSLANNEPGPAAYDVKMAHVLSRSPRVTFSRSSRFTGPGSFQTLCNSPSSAVLGTLSPTAARTALNHDLIATTSPRYSFGPSPSKDGQSPPMRYKPRTSFMTHSIRGGLAKPATLECNVGPGDYSPRTGLAIADSLERLTKDAGSSHSSVFGSAPRFAKPGLEYISAQHVAVNIGHQSPGPKYITPQPQVYRNALRPEAGGRKWLP